MAKDEYMFVNDDWLPEGILERIKNLGCEVWEIGEPYAFRGPATAIYCPTKEQIELAAKMVGEYYIRSERYLPPVKIEIYKKVEELFF